METKGIIPGIYTGQVKFAKHKFFLSHDAKQYYDDSQLKAGSKAKIRSSQFLVSKLSKTKKKKGKI